MKLTHALVFSTVIVFPFAIFAQAVRPLPYSAQLATDPGVGNVQGIQRYGRQLKTDPDQGEGYSYHVYPVSHVGAGTENGGTGVQSGVVSPGTFDWTSGIRNYGAPNAPSVPGTVVPTALDSETGTQAAGVTRSGLTTTLTQIYHQPLIQIKMRVVEVARTDGVAIGSILEYVSKRNDDTSLTSGQTANHVAAMGNVAAMGFENFRSAARLLLSDGLTSAASGTGSLINLTSEHINWLVQGLATELNADVITAPEVVTLNGQNVEFVSGDRLPFQLGQNVIQGSNNNIQQVFYKHVGTMVSVTPRIVNWGYHGEGQGEASIQGSEILDWKKLIDTMIAKEITHKPGTEPNAVSVDIKETVLDKYQGQQFVPFSAQSEILLALNNYSRDRLQFLIELAEQEIITDECCNRCRSWRPNNCTIDLAVVVRLSEGAPGTPPADSDDPTIGMIGMTEANIRAVANVIQVQNGQGVVMAGLIGERETENATKVPLLGDLPFAGALFRSKAVTREKTEVLIFIEAEVLDPDPNIARAQSSQDFLLGQAYVQGDLLCNPLEAGMHRIGFGTYLPPHSKNEEIFWESYNRSIRKVHSHISDIVEP